MQTITLELTVAEINLILEALGQLPFKQVYQLVGKIQSEASAQLQAAPTNFEGANEPITTQSREI